MADSTTKQQRTKEQKPKLGTGKPEPHTTDEQGTQAEHPGSHAGKSLNGGNIARGVKKPRNRR